MKKISYFLNKILYPACLYFTIIVFILGSVTTSITEYDVPILNMFGVSLAMLFCFGFSCINRLLFIDSFKVITRVILHFVGFISVFALTFIVIGGFTPTTTTAFVLLAAVSIVYIVIASIALIIRAIIKKNKTEKSDYKRQFGK